MKSANEILRELVAWGRNPDAYCGALADLERCLDRQKPHEPEPLPNAPKEHDIVQLKTDYAGVPCGTVGVVVHTYPGGDEVEVEFPKGNVVAVMTQWLDIVPSIH